MPQSLPWPDAAEVLPIIAVRATVDRLTSLAHTHPEDATLIPGAAVSEEELAADPPPALEQLTDELGGVEVRGLRMLDLLVEDRTDVGPYTLLGDPTTFYPLYETPDAAVILTLDETGAPGAVYGIGEDLALQLAAPDLATYLERFADALEATLTTLAERGDDAGEKNEDRTDAAGQLLDHHLFAQVLGMRDLEQIPAVALQDPAGSGIADLPAGTVAVADLRQAPVGARADVMDAEVPGDPLAMQLAWREGGRVLCVLGG
jgi:hypothetical protein